MKTLEDAPLLDTASPEYRADPRRVLADLRQQSWLVRDGIGGTVIGRPQLQTLLADRRLRSSLMPFIELQGVTEGILHRRMSATLLALDGEDHQRVRKLVRKAFMPASVTRHRPLMRSVLDALLAPVLPLGAFDFMAAVAEHYPIQVMCQLLGVPSEDHEQFTRWIKSIAWTLSLSLGEHFGEAEGAMQALDDYVTDLIAARRGAPEDDLVTELVQLEEAGDRLSDDELRSLIIGLLFAGYDTTRNQLGLAMLVFAEHPEQWYLLRDQPGLAAQAVEECMRYWGAVPNAPRLVAEDFELDGYRLQAGTLLMLSTASANHDETVYEQPGTFDITLPREPQLTFGGGPHFCLGAGLARAELQEALPMLAAALPGLRLDGEPKWRPPMGITGPETLPIRFGVLASESTRHPGRF